MRRNSFHGWTTDGQNCWKMASSVLRDNIAGADIQADHTGLCLTAVRRHAFLHELDVPAATATDLTANYAAVFSERSSKIGV
jgi:hypothetical protein